MKDFIFHCPTKIIFGKNTENNVGKEIKTLDGSKVLLHYGSGSIKKIGLYDRVIKSLKGNNLDYIELAGVKPNPRLSMVMDGINLCRREKVNFILAVGGGSVIDSAKAIAAGINYDGEVWDFFTGKTTIKRVVNIGVILTISAAGSEASQYTVITNESELVKTGIGSDLLRPSFAIMNPEITYLVPKYHKFCGVVDIMAHIIERYFGKKDIIGLNDLFCESALKNIIKNALILLDDQNNYNAHAEIMWTGTIAQNDFLSSGVTSDFEVHTIEHELSAFYDISHGGGLAILLPAWMHYVYENSLNKFVRFSEEVWEITDKGKSLEEIALKGIGSFEDFISKLGLPLNLKNLKINDDQFDKIAKRCTEKGPIGVFKPLEYNDVVNILKMSL